MDTGGGLALDRPPIDRSDELLHDLRDVSQVSVTVNALNDRATVNAFNDRAQPRNELDRQ